MLLLCLSICSTQRSSYQHHPESSVCVCVCLFHWNVKRLILYFCFNNCIELIIIEFWLIIEFCFSFMVRESLFPFCHSRAQAEKCHSHVASKVTPGMDIQATDKGRESRFGLQPAGCWPVFDNVSSIRSGALPVLFTLDLLCVQTHWPSWGKVFLLCLNWNVPEVISISSRMQTEKSLPESDVVWWTWWVHLRFVSKINFL